MENNGQSLSDHMLSSFEAAGGESQDQQQQTEQTPQVNPVDAFFGQEPEGDPEGTPNVQDGNIELALDPDTVVGKTPDGKPITAAEVQRSFLREADYTRKTMEIADVRKKASDYDTFVQENGEILADLDSGDESRVIRGLEAIAKARGVQLPNQAPPQSQRGPDGRFLSKSQSEFQPIDLEELVPGTSEYQMAQTVNRLIELNQQNPEMTALKEELTQMRGFFNTLNQGIQTNQMRSEMDALAGQWSTKVNFKEADIDGAMELVGKPISAVQAMQLHHMSKYMKHMVTLAQGNQSPPNVFSEPAAGGSAPVNPENMSLAGFISRRFGG